MSFVYKRAKLIQTFRRAKFKMKKTSIYQNMKIAKAFKKSRSSMFTVNKIKRKKKQTLKRIRFRMGRFSFYIKKYIFMIKEK